MHSRQAIQNTEFESALSALEGTLLNAECALAYLHSFDVLECSETGILRKRAVLEKLFELIAESYDQALLQQTMLNISEESFLEFKERSVNARNSLIFEH